MSILHAAQAEKWQMPEQPARAPAEVVVALLSADGDGTANEALINEVKAVLNDETVRPVADRLTVKSAEIISYKIDATLYFYPGPESEPILQAARAQLEAWLAEQRRIGRDVARSAIMAALHVPGVQRVELTQPAKDLVISETQAARCSATEIRAGGSPMSKTVLPPSASVFLKTVDRSGEKSASCR